MTLSIYEQKEWDRLQQRKAACLRKQSKRLLPLTGQLPDSATNCHLPMSASDPGVLPARATASVEPSDGS
jgi:hypothetical protein